MQNRESTEGCSKCIVRKNNDKLNDKEMDWSQQEDLMQVPKWDGTRCPEE